VSLRNSVFSWGQIKIWDTKFYPIKSTDIDRVNIIIGLEIRVFKFWDVPIIVDGRIKR
jgi:hypothetical protein